MTRSKAHVYMVIAALFFGLIIGRVTASDGSLAQASAPAQESMTAEVADTPASARPNHARTDRASIINDGFLIKCRSLQSPPYRVKPNDTLGTIVARQVNLQATVEPRGWVSLEEAILVVAKINNLSDPARISAGSDLEIPESCDATAL